MENIKEKWLNILGIELSDYSTESLEYATNLILTEYSEHKFYKYLEESYIPILFNLFDEVSIYQIINIKKIVNFTITKYLFLLKKYESILTEENVKKISEYIQENYKPSYKNNYLNN